MSQYYIDLNLGSTVDSGTGTETDPFSVKKFRTWNHDDLINVDDVCFFRGTCEITDTDFGVKRGILKAWDKDLYGPWRIKSNARNYGYGIFFQDGVSSVSDGIFCCIGDYVMSISIEAQNVYNCAFLNYSQTQNNGIRIWARDQQVNIYGCIFDSNYFETRLDNRTNIYIKDSSIKTTSFTRSGSSYITYANCAIQNGNLIPESYTTFVQTQLDWVPPDMPAWNAAKELFDVSMIYADVDTPPQPGEPPYTGYETFLWGSARTGIGTGYTAIPITSPNWILTYPKTTIVRYTKASFLVEINMNGIAYFVILSKDSAAPSSSQVKAGTDSTDQPVSLGYSGSVVLLENVEGSLNAIDLVSGDYDVYFVAEGESLQDVPVMLPIQVPKVEPINPDKPGHTLYNVVLAGNSEVDSSLPKVTSMFRNIILPKTKNNK